MDNENTNANAITGANDTNAETVQKYINLVYKISITRLGDYMPSSVDDACQQVFLNFISSKPVFKDVAQEKAWFIKVTVNVCNNLYKQYKRKSGSTIELDEIAEMPFSSSNSPNASNSFSLPLSSTAADILDIISVLPVKLRDAFYLTCIEEYTSEQAAKILNITGMAVRTRVKRAKQILRNTYKREDFIYEQ